MSNAKTQTFTFTSSTLTSFLFLVMSCWNGSTFFSSTSHATVSQSSTKLFVVSLTHVGSLARISGYFFDRSSEFLENMFEMPLSDLPSVGIAVANFCGASCAT